MKFIRLYTGDDGHTHIEELDWESRPEFTDLHSAKGVTFRAAEVGRFSDWHVAPAASTSSPCPARAKSACATAPSTAWAPAT